MSSCKCLENKMSNTVNLVNEFRPLSVFCKSTHSLFVMLNIILEHGRIVVDTGLDGRSRGMKSRIPCVNGFGQNAQQGDQRQRDVTRGWHFGRWIVVVVKSQTIKAIAQIEFNIWLSDDVRVKTLTTPHYSTSIECTQSLFCVGSTRLFSFSLHSGDEDAW